MLCVIWISCILSSCIHMIEFVERIIASWFFFRRQVHVMQHIHVILYMNILYLVLVYSHEPDLSACWITTAAMAHGRCAHMPHAAVAWIQITACKCWRVYTRIRTMMTHQDLTVNGYQKGPSLALKGDQTLDARKARSSVELAMSEGSCQVPRAYGGKKGDASTSFCLETAILSLIGDVRDICTTLHMYQLH